MVDEDEPVEEIDCGEGACARRGTTRCVNGEVRSFCEPVDPGLVDDQCDAIDQDCDGLVDEGFVSRAFTCGVGACQQPGREVCFNGTVIADCRSGVPAEADDVCDGIDDDCDERVDEDCTSLDAGLFDAGLLEDSGVDAQPLIDGGSSDAGVGDGSVPDGDMNAELTGDGSVSSDGSLQPQDDRGVTVFEDVSIGAYCADGGFCFDGTIELTCEQGGPCTPDFALNAEKINPVDNGCVCSSERKESSAHCALMLLFMLSSKSTRSQIPR